MMEMVQMNAQGILPLTAPEQVPDEHKPGTKFYISSSITLQKPKSNPKWLTRNVFICVYMLGTVVILIVQKFASTTTEEWFTLSAHHSKQSADASTFSSLVWFPLISYFGKSHPPKWMAMGGCSVALSCLLRIVSTFLTVSTYENALEISRELNFANILCNKSTPISESCDLSWTSTKAVDFAGNSLLQFGVATHCILGLIYIDNNSHKNVLPIIFAILSLTYTIAPIIGPTLIVKVSSIPNNMNWIAWIPLGMILLFSAFILSLFPRQLSQLTISYPSQCPNRRKLDLSWKDFQKSANKLVRNKIFVPNFLTGIFLGLSVFGTNTFVDKYIETQTKGVDLTNYSFLLTYFTELSVLSVGLSGFLGGLIIFRSKPETRDLIMWNVLVGIFVLIFSFIFKDIHCAGSKLSNPGIQNSSCNMNCHCELSGQVSPICTQDHHLYLSPCLAGCETTQIFKNKSQYFFDCACVSNHGISLSSDFCLKNMCVNQILGTLGFSLVTKCLLATAQIGYVLINFRCVRNGDKILAIGFSELILVLLIPLGASNLFNYILEPACTVWHRHCHKMLCIFYDGQSVASSMNFTIMVFTSLFIFSSLCVWYNVKKFNLFEPPISSKLGGRRKRGQAAEEEEEETSINEDSTLFSQIMRKQRDSIDIIKVKQKFRGKKLSLDYRKKSLGSLQEHVVYP